MRHVPALSLGSLLVVGLAASACKQPEAQANASPPAAAAAPAPAPPLPSPYGEPYQLVEWPKLPQGMFFGTKGGFPDPAARDREAAQRRAQQASAQGQGQGG